MSISRVLVIDDDDLIREVARDTLELVMGWAVITAGGGEEGIVLAGKECPDAILLDAMMPGLDGPETLRRLQADVATRHIPVIFLTAKVQAPDRRRFAELGAKGLIPKPFDPMTLGDDVARLAGA